MIPEHAFLKVATGEMIKGAGGLEAAAQFCRVGKSVLGDAQNINAADRFVALDVVADLEPLTRDREGWPHVTRALCTLMGGTFVALPKAKIVRHDLLGSLARLAQDAAKVSAEICNALANDNDVDAAEATRIRIQIAEAQADLACMDGQLNAIIRGER